MVNISQLGRTTNLMGTDNLLAALQRSQRELLDAQEAISTGVDVARPSEYPARTSAIMVLQQQLEARAQSDRNLTQAAGMLNSTDAAIADINNMLLEAKTVASSQIGVGSDAETRANQAVVVREQLRAVMDIANRQYQNVSLFGGRTTKDAVFQEFLGGIRYLGSKDNLSNDVGLSDLQGLNANGNDVFGALSVRVEGTTDLDPGATGATLLNDLNGAQGAGIRQGQLLLDVNGSSVNVDLSNAKSMDDVVTLVNDAITNLAPGTGSLAVAGDGFALTATAGNTITLSDIGTGQVAGDLGIEITAASGVTAGSDVGPRVTELTTLASLGVAIDFASGLKITQGSETKIADFSGATTIQDMVNVVDGLGLALRLEINDDGDGLNLFSDVSGLELSIGENAGGSTATDLGLRTYNADTKLADFRLGLGVEPKPGVDDFRFQVHDGTTFDVNADGLTDVSDVIAAISAAATGAGLTVGALGSGGTDFNIGLAADGNGMVFEDNTAGGSDFRTFALNGSSVVTQLGIDKNASAGGSITGDDNAKVRVESVFTHLQALHDSLVNNDEFGIVFAGEGVERDIDLTARARADVGVRARRVEQQQERSSNLRILEETTLSDLRDADLTEVITRFQLLQQQLQASMTVGAQNLQLSFLDFLR